MGLGIYKNTEHLKMEIGAHKLMTATSGKEKQWYDSISYISSAITWHLNE